MSISPGPDKLLTPQELADFLDVPLTTVYRWRSTGDGPPGVRLGRHVRYSWAAIQRFLDRQAAVETARRGGA